MDLPNADPCWNVRKGARMQSTAKYVWCALNRTLTTMDEVIEGAAKDIGICELKEEQKTAVYLFVGGKDGLFPCRQGMASRFVSLCYLRI